MERKGSGNRVRKEATFDLHLPLGRPPQQYNALTDPHANYYFVGKVAKQRLRDLKVQMRRSKSPRKKEMLKLINQKIRFQFPKIKLPLLQNATAEQRQLEKERKLSEPLHLKVMTERGRPSLKSSFKQMDKASLEGGQKQLEVEIKTSQLMKKGKSRKRLKHQKTEMKSKNKVNHEDFLTFLSKKRQEVIQPASQAAQEEQ